MIYRLHISGIDGESQGYEFFTSRSGAVARRHEWCKGAPDHDLALCGIDRVQTPKTKAQMVQLLAIWGNHADNG